MKNFRKIFLIVSLILVICIGKVIAEDGSYSAVVGRYEEAEYYCDGVDDNVQIQQAIDAVSVAGRGTVFISAGVYDIDDTITIPSKVTIKGEGERTILFAKENLNKEILKNSDSTNGNERIKITNLTIDGNDANQTIEKEGILRFDKVKNLVIEENYFHNFYGDALRVWIGGYQSETATAEGKIRIVNNTIKNVTGSTYGKGIGVAFGREILIENNIVDNVSAQAIWVGKVSGAVIDGNVTSQSKGIWTNYLAYDVVISDNYIEGDEVANGIGVFWGTSFNVVIQGNIIVDPEIYGIWGYDGSNIIVDSNIIRKPDRRGIVFNPAPEETKTLENVSITNNIIEDPNLGNTNYEAIEIDGSHANANVHHVQITGNEVIGGGDSVPLPISVIGVNDFQIINNSHSFGKYHGISIDSSNNGIVDNNVIKNADQYGILINNSNYIVIASNRCYDDQNPKTQDYGIKEIGTSNYNIISNNLVQGNGTAGISFVGESSSVHDNL